MHLKLCLVLMVALTRKFYSDAGECMDSGQKTANHKTIYTPRHCVPTTCKVTASNGAAVNGFNCTVGNGGRSPTACFNFRNALATSGRGGHGPSCPATLARISHYVFSCKEAPYDAVSLNFTFDLPTCGRTLSGPRDAVMAVFSARNETTDRYYTANPICRVFSFGNNDLRHFGPDKSVLVQYDCMAMGLQTAYPKVLYYQTLTTFPWGDVLNYTIVYLAHASEGSMQLVAGAWLPGRRIHVVFETAWSATSYRVQAKGEQVFFSKKVPSSSPSVEIGNIPPQAHTVIVTVEAVEWELGQCPSFRRVCSPIEVMLHDRSQLNLSGRPQPVKGNDGEGNAEKMTPAVETGVVIVVATVAAAAIVVVTLVAVCRWKPCVVPGKQLRVLIGNGAPQDAMAGKILTMLGKRGFLITEAFQNPDPCSWESTPQPAVLRSQDVILLFIHPAAQGLQSGMQGLVKALFQMALVTKTRVVSLVDEQGNYVMPSEMFLPGLIPLNNSRSDDFLRSLDRATFYMPGELKGLMGLLKELSHSRGSKLFVFFRNRPEIVKYDRERDEVALSALLGSLSASGDSVPNGELRQSDRDSFGGETCAYSGSCMEANGTISSQEQRQNTVRVEAQVHPGCEGGPSSASIGHETGNFSQVPCSLHSAAGRRADVDRDRQRCELTGVVLDPWMYGGCGHPPLSACDISPQKQRYDNSDHVQEDHHLSGQPSDSSRRPDMFNHSRDHAVLQNSTGEICHSCVTTPLLDHDTEVKHPSLSLAPFRRQYSSESEIPSDILSAPTLSSVLSSEHRQLPEGSEDQAALESADDRQSQNCSEETGMKSVVPTALAQSERRDWVEGRERLGHGQSSPQNQPEDVPKSASNRRWSDVEYQESSWPSQSRPVPEGESLPENRPDGKSRVQSHTPVVSEHAPTQYCARHLAPSDLSHSATPHDSHSRSSRTAVGESPHEPRPVRDASQATAAGTFVPKYPPLENWSQRIDRDRRSSDRLARMATNTNTGYVARPPCAIDRPWLVPDCAMDSVDRVAQELFDMPQNLVSGAAGPVLANGQHSEPGAFAGAENERLELRDAPPGAGICGNFRQMNGPVNGHGNLGPVNGHGNLGWRGEGLREFLPACRNDPVENGESSSEQCSAGSGRNGSSRNGGLEGGQDGQGELGHLGFARPEPVEDTESSGKSMSNS